MSRSRVDLPQPEGPISDTNSPGAIARLMSSSAIVRPPELSNVLPTPLTETTAAEPCSLISASPDRRIGPAAQRIQLQQPDREEEGEPQQGRREDRRPELLGPGRVLLVE